MRKSLRRWNDITLVEGGVVYRYLLAATVNEAFNAETWGNETRQLDVCACSSVVNESDNCSLHLPDRHFFSNSLRMASSSITMQHVLRKVLFASPQFQTDPCKRFMSQANRQKTSDRPRKAAPAPLAGRPNRQGRLAESFRLEDSLPPLALLNSAYKSGALALKPDEAIQLIAAYIQAFKDRGPSWERNFLSIAATATPETLTLLGQLLNRCSHNAQRFVGKQMMLTASVAGHADATLALLVPAHRSGSLSKAEYQAPLKHLRVLAKSRENVQAMVLLGRIVQDEGREQEALDLFEAAAKSTAVRDGAVPVPIGAAEALVYAGEVQLKRGQKGPAEEMFRKAALDLDNPLGYYHLAKLQEEGTTNKEVYLLKAASSGVSDAAFEIGIIQWGKWDVVRKGGEEMRKAKEWFHLGAVGGHGLSMIALARILDLEGDVSGGQKWEDAVERLPDVLTLRAKVEELKLSNRWR